MTLLANVNAVSDPPPSGEDRRRLEVSFDVTRTTALLVFGALCIVGAVILWALDKGTGAASTFALGEAIVVGGFGIALGEKGGAEAAQNALRVEPQ